MIRSPSSKMAKCWSINSEPVIFLFSISLGLYVTIYQAFIKFKLCLPLATEEICRNLKNYPDKHLENVVSAEAAHYSMYLQICSSLPSFFVSFFIGAWSDAHGRKTPLLVAMSGISLNAVLLIFIATVNEMPLWVMPVGALITGFTGQIIIVFSCCFSMISDSIKDPDLLTIRIGLGSSLVYFGIVCGSLMASLITSRVILSYEYTFLIGASFATLGVIYVIFFVKETIHLTKSHLINSTDDNIEFINDNDSKTFCASIIGFFHYERIKENIDVLIRPRNGRRRCHLNLGVIIFLVIFSCDVGIPGLQYLFVTRDPLNFTDSWYGDLVAVQTASAAVGMMILPVILKKVLHLTDTWLITLGFLFSIGKSLMFAFSRETWMVFLSGTFNFGAALYFPGCRAYLTKLIDRSETARLFATLSSVEQIGPLIAGVIFNNIYAATLQILPGFVWILGASITGLMLVFVFWLQYDSSKENYDSEQAEDLLPVLDDPHEVVT